MDATQLAELAQAGATALIAAMTTDVWSGVRARAAALLAGGDADRERTAAWLDERRSVVTAGAADAAVMARTRLAEALWRRVESDPAAAAALEQLVLDVAAHARGTGVSLQARASGSARVYQAGRDLTVRDEQG